MQLHHISPREIECDIATIRTVFPYAGLWYYGHQGMLVASNRPLTKTPLAIKQFESSGLPGQKTSQLMGELEHARIVSSEGMDKLLRETHPIINTDNNRWLEYATPRYQATAFDWTTYNLAALARYK